MQRIETVNKIASISQQIAQRVRRDCQCALTTDYITAERLTCDDQETTHVIYRARISSAPDVANTDLINNLQLWVTSGGASVTLESIQLNLDPSCAVLISSFDDPICPAPTEPTLPTNSLTNASQGLDNNIFIYVILGLVVFVIILIVVLVCAACIWQRHFRKYRLG